MWILYQIGLVLALLASAPYLLLRRGRHYLSTLRGRLARELPAPTPGPLWLHAVSVGEVAIAATVIDRLEDTESLLVTTVTPTGQSRARDELGSRATVGYLPFDLGPPLRRFFDHHRPRALVLIEGELWPLLLRVSQRRGLPVVMVNGRLGDRSYRRMQALRPWLSPLFRPVTRFLVQSELDRDRFVELGVPRSRVVVTGNLKYDSPAPARRPETEDRITSAARDRPILIAGSTMEGEEPAVLEAFRSLGAGQRALLVLAPRHPERFDAVAELVRNQELALVRRSDGGPPGADCDVFLLDSLGDLAAVYRLGLGAFIGGTLVATGGHNPLEAARFAKPIAVGPSMENFREIAARFDQERAWRRVASSAELARVFGNWLDDPVAASALGDRARALFERDRGALERTLEQLRPILANRSRSAS